MICQIYSMEKGKETIENVKFCGFRGTDIFEIQIFEDHIPIIGEIDKIFYIVTKDQEMMRYDIRAGFFEYKDGVMSIVAQFV